MDNKQLHISNKYILVVAFILMTTSVMVLIGWKYHISVLTNISSSWVSLKINTAFCFIFSGLALMACRDKNQGLATRVIIITASLIILLIASLTLYEYLSGLDLGIDQFFTQESLDTNSKYPGRMRIINAINWIVVAFIFLYQLRKSASAMVIQTVAWLIFCTSLFSLYNYINDVNLHLTFAYHTTMALHTDLLFILLSAALFIIKPNAGVIAIILRKNTSGYILRRIIPLILFIPMFLFGVEQIFEKTLWDPSLGDSLIGTGIFILISIAMFVVAYTLDRQEQTKAAVEKQLQESEMLFSQYAKHIDIVFFRTSPDINTMLYISPAYEKIWGRSTKSLYENPKEWFESVTPEDQELVYKTFFEGFKKGELSASAEYRIKRPDNTERNILARAFQLQDKYFNPWCIIGIAIDITDITREKKYGQIRHDIINILNTRNQVSEILPAILNIICSSFNLYLGQAWMFDNTSKKMRCVDIWYLDSLKLTEYIKKYRRYSFDLGKGFPGQISEAKKPVWIPEFSISREHERTSYMANAGLHSAFGIPFIFQDKVLGVMEFFSEEIAKPNESLLSLMSTIGEMIGEFIHRIYTEEQLKSVAQHDLLTDLLNLSALEEILDKVIHDEPSRTIAVLIIDVDKLKKINEARGHHVGDSLLKLIALRLREVITNEQINLARLGDKFILCMSNQFQNTEKTLEYASKIQHSFKDVFIINDEELYITVCIGIAFYPHDATQSKMLISNADVAVMQAKNRGGNQIVCFSKELATVSIEKFSLREDLRKAVTRNEFNLYFQPQIDLNTGRICGAEALVRWFHPVKGIISPAHFIKLAEEEGLIVSLNEHIMRMVFQQMSSQWLGPKISINISAKQFNDQYHFVEYLEALISEFHVEPKRIELEITESILMENTRHSLAVLTALRLLDFSIALDDFGTGFSSLSYLQRLPIQIIKIDRSFITGLPGNEKNATLVSSLINMLHALGKTIVAEGAETESEIEFLKNEKCDIVQGYYYYKPMPTDAFIALCQEARTQKKIET